jgi:hypothetical protein
MLIVQLSDLCRRVRGRGRGSILPIAVFILVVLLGYLAFFIDVTRTMHGVKKLEFAAAAAALHALSQSVDPFSGKYAETEARERMMRAVVDQASLAGSVWNVAPGGGGGIAAPYEQPVEFSANDVEFLHNPDDQTELLLRVSAHRRDENALHNLLLPVLQAGVENAIDLNRTEMSRTVEVIGQAASRVGKGCLHQNPPVFACLPIALSNVQFRSASMSERTLVYVVDIFQSRNPRPIAPGRLRGHFINIAAPSSSRTVYGDFRGLSSVNDLVGLLRYFWISQPPGAVAPAVVERGSRLAPIDVGDDTIRPLRRQIWQTLVKLPTDTYYILPVVASDPVKDQVADVVGFARMKLMQVAPIDEADPEAGFQVFFEIGESVVMSNASCAEGSAVVPEFEIGTYLPYPTEPFKPRSFDLRAQRLSARPRGVVMAPVLSPRPVNVISEPTRI